MKRIHGRIAGAVLFVAMVILVLLGAEGLSAQSGPPSTQSVYQYVGINQTIARISNATGKIEILEQHDAPGLSLVHPQARPWEWREIRIRKHIDRRRGSARTSNEADDLDRDKRP